MPTADDDDQDDVDTHHRECSCRLCCYIRARLSPTPIGVEWYDVVRYARRHGFYKGIWIAGSDYVEYDEDQDEGDGVDVRTPSGETIVEVVSGLIGEDDLLDFATAISGWDGNTQ